MGAAPTLESVQSALQRLPEAHPGLSFELRLWDGRRATVGRQPRATLTFQDPETLQRCLAAADPTEFAEAYVDGRLLVDGDMRAAIDAVYALSPATARRSNRTSAMPGPQRGHPHTTRQDERDVRGHYDLGDDFFRLFLDARMVYSCAYFDEPTQNLEAAQERKLDLVCRKLRLRPPDLFLDVGCGWGALVIWAASHYGVRARGITLSEQQAAEARRRVDAAGLTGRVTIERRHYADLPAGAFNKIASVGMYEHVGLANLPAYLDTVWRALADGGLFLNHGITQPPDGQRRTGGDFIFRHVFPGAELAPLSTITATMEQTGFEVLDVHALRPHYALTLRAWHDRFVAAKSKAAAIVSPRTLRIWDVYLAGCAKAFDIGLVGVHQVLASKTDASGRAGVGLIREA